MSSWLITGGAGFIGSNLVRAALRHTGDQIIVLDALTYAGNLANISDLLSAGSIQFVHGDICDAQLVDCLLEDNDVTRILHLAAESHVDRSISGPAAFLRTNIDGTACLLQAAAKHWAGDVARRRFIHVSTDEVYGSLAPAAPAFDESTPYSPNSPYSASKAASDHLVRAWHHTYGFPGIITNCSNNYGPWQFPEKLIPLCVLNAVEGKPLPVYGDGMQIRDWLHVEDHCAALLQVTDRGVPGRTYCIGGNSERTNMEVVTLICQAVDTATGATPGSAAALVRHVTDRPGHDRRYAINASRIRDELGFQPSHVFEESLPALVHWYLENRDWSNAIRDGSYQDFYAAQYCGLLA